MGNNGRVRRTGTQTRHEPVLGTTLDLQATVRVSGLNTAKKAERMSAGIADRALAEFDRLSMCFSVYDDQSRLCRWRASAPLGETIDVGSDLASMLARSAQWQVASGGLYNPSVGVLTERWKRAERDGVLPSNDELAELAGRILKPPYVVDATRVTAVGDCSHLSFNSFAKGVAIDQVADLLWAEFPLDRLIVNVGGDLCARSSSNKSGARVGIEHPTITYSNEPPVRVVTVTNAGLATSGSSHRGFTVKGDRYSHLIDPRTGWPVDRERTASSVTIVAKDAATADVLATVAAMCAPAAIVETVETTARAVDASGPTPAVGAVTSQLQWFSNAAFDALATS